MLSSILMYHWCINIHILLTRIGNYKVPELLISQCADAVHLNTQITSIEKVKQTPSPPQAQAQKPSSSMSPLPIFYKLTATSSVVDANDGSEADLDDMNLEFDAIVLATPIELTIHRQPQERSGGRRYNDGNGIDTSNSENINDSIIADVNMHETVRLDDSLTMTLKGSVFSEKTKRFWRERQHASLFQQTVATFVTGVINPAYFDTKGGSTASTSISSSLLLSLFSILSLLPLSPSDGQSDPADVPGVILTREPSSPSSLSSLNSVLFSSLGKYDKLTQTQAPGNDERKDGPDHEKTTPELSNSNENPDMRVWKIFSREELTEDELERLFTKVVNATVIPWRAYPHYVVSPQAETLTSFRIDEYDDETSATDNKSSNTKTVRRDDGSGFGVYYPNAIEWTASAMEMGAIGGYNSALLIHNQDRRLRDEMHRDTEEKEKEEICVA